MTAMDKISVLKDILKKQKKVCIAYSGGTDSDFLLNVAKEVLGENVIAIIGNGVMMAEKDLKDAVRLVEKTGVRYYIAEVDLFSVDKFKNNDKERCYFCKRTIMSSLREKAKELGFEIILDGKNFDDAKVYRPGAKAAEEMGIKSPLCKAEFTKEEIRLAAKEMGIDTWNKASNSCLATRFPYDTVLTSEKFEMVEKAEKLISDYAIESGRVRLHGDVARIEIPKSNFSQFIDNRELLESIKQLGFKYITLDLEGFRSGSMD